MASTIKVDTIENVAGSGNVSLGSGHNLVVPGNSTVGGTFGVTGNTTLTGNLGVGAAPERKFHVEGSGAEFSLVDTSRPTDKKTMNMFIDANGKGNIRMMNDAQSAGNAAIVIEGSSPHTAPVVTTPYQPSFKAQRSGSNVTSGTVVFNITSHNIGNHYSTSTGRFTAPVSGRYIFSLVAMAQSAYFRGQIFVNSSGITQFRTDHDGAQDMNYMQATITVIYNLAANDYVFMQVDAGAAGGNTAEMQFYGHLLG